MAQGNPRRRVLWPQAQRRGFNRRHTFIFIALLARARPLVAGCGLPGTIEQKGRIADAGPSPTPTPLPPIMFPQDEAPHRNLTEWWYYTGHFHGTDAQGKQHEYGFELTVFQTLRGQVCALLRRALRHQRHHARRVPLRPARSVWQPGRAAGAWFDEWL